MAILIDLSPTEETWLETAAQQNGLTPNMLAQKLLRERLLSLLELTSASEEARVSAIWAALGSMAHIGTGVDDLHRERQDDKRKEDTQFAGKA